MKILYVNQHFRTLARGGGTRGLELGRRWVEAGHEVTVVAGGASEPGTPVLVEECEGINVHTLPVEYSQTMGNGRRILAFLSFVWKSARYVRTLPKHDVVLATSTPLTVAVPGIVGARAHRTRMVFEVRDLWPEVPIAMGALPTPPLRFLASQLERFVYSSAHHVVALSAGMRDGVLRQGADAADVSVIPNASDVSLFAVSSEVGATFRSENPWIGDGPLVIYTGTFGPANKASWIVDLAREVTAKNTDVRFLLVGEGNERNSITEYAREQGLDESCLQIWGHRSKTELVAILSAADLALSVFAPLRELQNNSPNKAFDAFASGTPVAINNGGWLGDVLDASGAGLNLPYDDVATAGAAVAGLLGDPEAHAAAAQAAMVLANGPFSRDRHADAYLEILESASRGDRVSSVDFTAEILGAAGSVSA